MSLTSADKARTQASSAGPEAAGPSPGIPAALALPERASGFGNRPAVRSRRSKKLRGYGLFALFAFPNLILIAVFAYWPVLGNLALSLTSWDMIAPQPLFIGLDNYARLFTDPEFLAVMRRTLVWVVCVVACCLVIGLALACLFNLKLPGGGAVSSIAFTPHVISGAAVAAVWLFIFDPNYGLSRAFFAGFGAASPSWTTESDWALPALIIVSIWKGVGFVSIVYLAALQGIPQDVMEAARLDGANRWQVFRHMTLHSCFCLLAKLAELCPSEYCSTPQGQGHGNFGKEISDVGVPDENPGRAAGRSPVDGTERARMIRQDSSKNQERFYSRAQRGPLFDASGRVSGSFGWAGALRARQLHALPEAGRSPL